ncbi:hypothetical protein GLOIN_2v1877571 [Rhizophagus clarus]|uniref:Uncharacterized protein n=1 Tax=Rhizophagus clarus TaxID=94130 RepID=A0A8H3KR54_9GLOM|nr:hypothetical protein GLOIN_2v1877571 [Rhizophagus clarus]
MFARLEERRNSLPTMKIQNANLDAKLHGLTIPPIYFRVMIEAHQFIEVCGKNIKKTYISPDARDHVERLVNIYERLVQKREPNVDRLDLYASKEKDIVYLSPKNQQELLEMLMDIRWPNII